MGADIHMYVEYRKREAEFKDWRDFGGRINPGRNYYMFGLLAGVRCTPEGHLEPKGMPSDAAWEAQGDATLYISDKSGDGCTTLDRAIGWGVKILHDGNGNPWRAEHPDYHSHSWVSTSEYDQILERFKKDAQGANSGWDGIMPEYEALLASMKRFEELGYEARIVFWFDN